VMGNPSDTDFVIMEAYEVTLQQEKELAKHVNEPAPVLGTLIRTIHNNPFRRVRTDWRPKTSPGATLGHVYDH
ncbi:MAG: hypothetical protein ACRDTF_07465, partial [Pseudonocardiaceae bacterium]